MKWLTAVLLIALFSFVAGLYLPWWTIAVVAAIMSVLMQQKPLKAFFAGFSALFLLWTILALWMSNANEYILARKVAALFFNSSQPYLLIIVTGLTGGIVAGLAALAGSFLAYSKNAGGTPGKEERDVRRRLMDR